MPVLRCPNGKWKIGSGPCIFTSKERADRAYVAYLAKSGEAVKKDNHETLSARVRHSGALILEQEFDSMNTLMNDAVKEKLPEYYMVDFSEESVLLRFRPLSQSLPTLAAEEDRPDIYYMVSYTVLDGEITFGTPVKVERVVSYVEVQEGKVSEYGVPGMKWGVTKGAGEPQKGKRPYGLPSKQAFKDEKEWSSTSDHRVATRSQERGVSAAIKFVDKVDQHDRLRMRAMRAKTLGKIGLAKSLLKQANVLKKEAGIKGYGPRKKRNESRLSEYGVPGMKWGNRKDWDKQDARDRDLSRFGAKDRSAEIKAKFTAAAKGGWRTTIGQNNSQQDKAQTLRAIKMKKAQALFRTDARKYFKQAQSKSFTPASRAIKMKKALALYKKVKS